MCLNVPDLNKLFKYPGWYSSLNVLESMRMLLNVLENNIISMLLFISPMFWPWFV